MIGHAGPACGLAGVVKAALALYQEILPPLDKVSPLPSLARAQKRFHIPQEPQYWTRNRAEGPRRAGVNALGPDGKPRPYSGYNRRIALDVIEPRMIPEDTSRAQSPENSGYNSDSHCAAGFPRPHFSP